MKRQLLTFRHESQRERLLLICMQSGLDGFEVLDDSFSDSHNGGICAALFLCKNRKYIYKPRPATADLAWTNFLEKITPLIDSPLPRAVRPIDSGEDYTIVPFVQGRLAENEDEVRQYFLRCGAMLALCMLLGSVDLHEENLIADGDSPLLVDVETLMSGITPDRAGRETVMYDALIASHLLPNWMLVDDENVDVGGLTGAGKNLLRSRDGVCPAHEHVEEICEGFRKTFAGILDHRDEIDRALDCFAGAPFRKLLRPTDLYGRLCDRIAQLETEEEKRACAERLRRAYTRGDAAWAEKMAEICQSEIDAVRRGDIPYFFGYAEERNLRDVFGAQAVDYYAYSPLEAVRLRLRALRPEDGVDQERIIRLNLRAVRKEIEARPLPSAREVFEMLEDCAIEGNPCSWMGLTTGARGEAYFQSIGFDLYEGLVGVLVFYGALYAAEGDEDVLRAIRKRYVPYRKMYVLTEHRIRADRTNIGLTGGVGGHIMALGYLARMLGDESFLDDAELLLKRFNFDGFDAFDNWDVFSGVSGLLIALPILKGRGMDAELAQIAAMLANGICKTEVTLTGYGHGAAGLALALGAAQYLGAGDYVEDILRLLCWENERYDADAMNWPDLRDPEKQGFMKGLCSGAPGIGLARLQLMRYVRDARVVEICSEDVQCVREFLRKQSVPLKRDTLCCGNAAMVEARRVLSGENDIKMNENPVLFHALGTDDFPIGLFQGWAGVGYAQARSESLFVWETEE